MQSPNYTGTQGAIPPPVSIVQQPNKKQSPSSEISNLTSPPDRQCTTFQSPIRSPDVGQPKTPEGRLVEPINEEAIDNGYDSDGLQAPWVGNQLQSPDQIEAEEEALPFGSPPSLPAEAPLENFAQKILSSESIDKLKVNELKLELKKRGMNAKGKKEELVLRLKEAVEKGVKLIENLTPEMSQNMAGDSFSPGAYWKLLECDGEYLDNVVPDGLRAPTVPDGEVPVVRKRNYKDQFDRNVFTGMAELPMRSVRGHIRRDNKGEVKYEIKP